MLLRVVLQIQELHSDGQGKHETWKEEFDFILLVLELQTPSADMLWQRVYVVLPPCLAMKNQHLLQKLNGRMYDRVYTEYLILKGGRCGVNSVRYACIIHFRRIVCKNRGVMRTHLLKLRDRRTSKGSGLSSIPLQSIPHLVETKGIFVWLTSSFPCIPHFTRRTPL